MGVRSPHEATAEASRPNNLHSRPMVCTRRCARTRHVADQIHFPRKSRTLNWDAELAFRYARLAFWSPRMPGRWGGWNSIGGVDLTSRKTYREFAKSLEGGLEVTAVHNHLLRAEPLTFYMHVGGHGDPVKMAETIRDALAVSRTPLTPAAPPAQPPAIDLDTAQIDQILGAKGANNGGGYSIHVPRPHPVTAQGPSVVRPM